MFLKWNFHFHFYCLVKMKLSSKEGDLLIQIILVWFLTHKHTKLQKDKNDEVSDSAYISVFPDLNFGRTRMFLSQSFIRLSGHYLSYKLQVLFAFLWHLPSQRTDSFSPSIHLVCPHSLLKYSCHSLRSTSRKCV